MFVSLWSHLFLARQVLVFGKGEKPKESHFLDQAEEGGNGSAGGARGVARAELRGVAQGGGVWPGLRAEAGTVWWGVARAVHREAAVRKCLVGGVASRGGEALMAERRPGSSEASKLQAKCSKETVR